jgi:hypothetical protein
MTWRQTRLVEYSVLWDTLRIKVPQIICVKKMEFVAFKTICIPRILLLPNERSIEFHLMQQPWTNWNATSWLYQYLVLIQIEINHQLYATVSPVYYLEVYLELNMFPTSSRPSSGAQQGHWQPLVLPLEPGGRGQTTLLPPHTNGKTRGCYCTCWAPDDGREDVRNMLSCK